MQGTRNYIFYLDIFVHFFSITANPRTTVWGLSTYGKYRMLFINEDIIFNHSDQGYVGTLDFQEKSG